MDLDSLSPSEQIAAWYILREGYTDMLKGGEEDKDEEDEFAPYVARALADKLVYG